MGNASIKHTWDAIPLLRRSAASESKTTAEDTIRVKKEVGFRTWTFINWFDAAAIFYIGVLAGIYWSRTRTLALLSQRIRHFEEANGLEEGVVTALHGTDDNAIRLPFPFAYTPSPQRPLLPLSASVSAAVSRYNQTGGYDRGLFLLHETDLEQLICAICQDVVRECVKTKCGHIFCKECMLSTLEASRNGSRCPIDRNVLGKGEIWGCPKVNAIVAHSQVACASAKAYKEKQRQRNIANLGVKANACFTNANSCGVGAGNDAEHKAGMERGEEDRKEMKYNEEEEEIVQLEAVESPMCMWTGMLKDLKEHEETCEFKKIECPYLKFGCLDKICLHDMGAHFNKRGGVHFVMTEQKILALERELSLQFIHLQQIHVFLQHLQIDHVHEITRLKATIQQHETGLNAMRNLNNVQETTIRLLEKKVEHVERIRTALRTGGYKFRIMFGYLVIVHHPSWMNSTPTIQAAETAMGVVRQAVTDTVGGRHIS